MAKVPLKTYIYTEGGKEGGRKRERQKENFSPAKRSAVSVQEVDVARSNTDSDGLVV